MRTKVLPEPKSRETNGDNSKGLQVVGQNGLKASHGTYCKYLLNFKHMGSFVYKTMFKVKISDK